MMRLLLIAVFVLNHMSVTTCYQYTPFKMENVLKKISKTASATLAGLCLISAPGTGFMPPALADSRLNAPTAAGTRVNSDPASLLRYGLPLNNKDAVAKEIREAQGSIESAKANLRTRRPSFAVTDLNNAQRILKSCGPKFLKAVPAENRGAAEASLERLLDNFGPVEAAIAGQTAAGSGSVQERASLDSAFELQDVLAKELSTFEETFVPKTFKRNIPEEYAGLPALQGRATVDMIIVKPDGSKYDVDGKLYDDVKLTMVIDGYNAPLTGGNFVDLVDKGYYNGKKITRSDGFVVQTGDNDPDGNIHGYIPPGASEERKVPLEIALKGEKELIYGSTSEDEGKGYAAATLPFQAYGALGMARSEFENDSASTQFFWLLFESDLTPAGKNMLDGRYSCFGYTVGNPDLLKGVKEGDVIKKATITTGKDNLVR